MASLSLFNTKSLKKEKFIPIKEGEVKLYLCGPTVYNYLHIGNFRGPITFNLLRNFLEYEGYKVTFVYNYTDVDDKIIMKAKEENKTPKELTDFYIKEFEKDFSDLKLKKHELNPRVTDFIDEIIIFISDLLKNNHAYNVDGEIYYAIDKHKNYGELSKKKLDELEAGNRVEVDQKKKNPFDFVLWKPAKEGEVSWDSPWGKGRPGWHIECSAMIHKTLGNTIDIHGGGVDLIFPHHENEIAQGEGRTGCNYCNYWVHNNFININDEKMSKSLGNIITAREFNKKYHPEILKYLFLSVHYRSVLSVTQDKIYQTIKALDRIYSALIIANNLIHNSNVSVSDEKAEPSFEKLLGNAKNKILKSLRDDLNSAEMIAQIFEVVRGFNNLAPKPNKVKSIHINNAKLFVAFIKEFGEMSSLFMEIPDAFLNDMNEILINDLNINKNEINDLIEQRNLARNQKDFSKADEIRQKLDELKIEVFDGEKTTWKVKI